MHKAIKPKQILSVLFFRIWLGICSNFTRIYTHVYIYMYTYINKCAFQFVYMCGMFGSNFTHESGRNVDNYFHFRTVGYFYEQQN